MHWNHNVVTIWNSPCYLVAMTLPHQVVGHQCCNLLHSQTKSKQLYSSPLQPATRLLLKEDPPVHSPTCFQTAGMVAESRLSDH